MPEVASAVEVSGLIGFSVVLALLTVRAPAPARARPRTTNAIALPSRTRKGRVVGAKADEASQATTPMSRPARGGGILVSRAFMASPYSPRAMAR